MPINIDGGGVTGVTIDGEEVIEITIDGSVAYRVLPDTIVVTEGGRLWNFLSGEQIYDISNNTGDDVGSVDIGQRYISYIDDGGYGDGVIYDYVKRTVKNKYIPTNGLYTDSSIGDANQYVFFTGNDYSEGYDFVNNTQIFSHDTNWDLGRIPICEFNGQYAIYGPLLSGSDPEDKLFVTDVINNDIDSPFISINELRSVDISPLYYGFGRGDASENDGNATVYRIRSSNKLSPSYNDIVNNISVADDITLISIKSTVEVYKTNTGSFETTLINPTDGIEVLSTEITNNYILLLDADYTIYVYDKSYSFINSFDLLTTPNDISAIERQ